MDARPADIDDLRLMARADLAGTRAIRGRDTSGVAEGVEDLDRVVLLGIAAELGRGSRLGAGGAHHAASVASDLGAAPWHRWIVEHWLASLYDADLVRRDADGRYGELHRPRRAELVAARARMEAACVTLGYPAELADMIRRSLGLLPALLCGEVKVQALLYPDGEPAAAEAVYGANVISRYLNMAAAEVARVVADRVDRPLRVLELGAGIGATTADVLTVLTGRRVEFYLYTDLSPFFLDAGRRRFPAPFLRYAVVDITADLYAQLGELGDGLDLVVAATVAHNATHVGRLLDTVAGLLAPGGRVILIETVREHPQSLTTMPFALSRPHADGPPEREDERAGTARTYLRREEWLGWLAGAGLRVEVDLPRDGDPLAALSQRVFAAVR